MLLPALVVALLSAVPVLAQSDPAPGDAPDREPTTLAAAGDTHLWLVRTEGQRFTLLHRGPETEEGAIYRVSEAPGRPVAAAAGDERLYLAFDDRSVRRFRYQPADGARSETIESEALPPLPTGTELIGWVAAEPGPVALLRSMADEDPSDSAERARSTAPVKPAPEEGAPGSADNGAPEAEGEAPDPMIRLVRLHRGRWEPIEPPEGLTSRRAQLLVALESETIRPAVLSEAGPDDDAGLRVHRFRGSGWDTERYALPLSEDARAVGVHRNLFLVQSIGSGGSGGAAEGSAELGIWWLRRGEAHRIGTTIAGPALGGAWWAFARDETVLLVRRDAAGGLSWTRCDVTAESPTLGNWRSLKVTDPPVSLPDPALVAIAIALVVGVFFLFITAQRDPQATVPKLPKEVQAAGLNRCFAAAVDLLPPLLLGMAVFQITNPIELFGHWPADSSADWQETLPGLLVIGTHALHTFLGETIFGSTIGKALFACRVTNLSGDRPAPWQVLVRNLFKIVEMTVPLLLILPLLRIPHHQRLGDLIAGTVVVVKAPSASSDTDTDTDAETPEE